MSNGIWDLTMSNAMIMNNLSSIELTKKISYLIKDVKKRTKLQKQSIKNFYLIHNSFFLVLISYDQAVGFGHLLYSNYQDSLLGFC